MGPKDHDIFSLKADKKFLQRHGEVEELLGSNLHLPIGFENKKKLNFGSDAKDMASDLKSLEEYSWDGIEDAFQPV